jgi:hypothetical protein
MRLVRISNKLGNVFLDEFSSLVPLLSKSNRAITAIIYTVQRGAAQPHPDSSIVSWFVVRSNCSNTSASRS